MRKIVLTSRIRRRARRELRSQRRRAFKAYGNCNKASLLNSYARWYF